MTCKTSLAISVAAFLSAAAPCAGAEQKYGPGVTDTEIKIGQTMPYSGPVSAARVIGESEVAYFKMINQHGGINGRRVTLISLDDAYSPSKTLEQTRRLVEQDGVLAIFGSFGTPTNAAIQRYLNSNHVPQLFIQAGASRWNDPSHFPWTIPFVNLLRSEAKVYGQYILTSSPRARVAILYQNDDFGRDYLEGMREKLGSDAAHAIVATAAYEASDPTIDSQILTLHASGADTLLIAASPKFAAQAIRKLSEIDWHPTRFLAEVSASVTAVLAPAGLDNSTGVMTTTSFKSVGDPQWATNPDYLAWLAFMQKYYSNGNTRDAFAFTGYSNATLFAEVLRRCGDDLTRENLMAVATHLQGVYLPALLPGITVNTTPDDYDPIKQMRLQRFDGRKWQLLPGVFEE
ncbi:ABC transporter substrate-binding protein [Bradyrhizobium sp.]|uniref:ABC transporter substrate-binding protein n=1 Tax=Bradyrhizobium sp. TaxID=376 RepID=UPI002603084A|nr:ABC transporter substrate-binding protein [Bradyrhizobium sp.]